MSAATPSPKVCGCGLVFGFAAWRALQPAVSAESADGFTENGRLEWRNCWRCGSTLMVVHWPHPKNAAGVAA